MILASNETQTSMLPSVASILDSFHNPKKSGSGDVPHKSPGNNALVEHESGLKKKLVQMPSRVPRSLSLKNLDIFAVDVMNDDVSMDDLFISSLTAMDRPKSPDWTSRSSIDGPRQWKIVLD